MSVIGVVLHFITATVLPRLTLWSSWFGLSVACLLLWLLTWVFTRRGARSLKVLRAVDVGAVLLTASLVGVMARMLASFTWVTPPHPDWSLTATQAFIGLNRASVGLGVEIALILSLVLRAALVPSRPMRTFLITGLAGIPIVVMMGLPSFPTDSVTMHNVPIPNAFSQYIGGTAAVWWLFCTGVSTVISAVIFGLRRDVRHARRLGQYRLESTLGEGVFRFG